MPDSKLSTGSYRRVTVGWVDPSKETTVPFTVTEEPATEEASCAVMDGGSS